MDKYPSLTKTCSSCGLEKPLSAFLQLGGTQGGALYGNICASCRKANMNKQSISKDSDGGTTSRTDHTLDSKMKLADEIGKKEHFKEAEEQYHKERDIEEEKQFKKSEKKEATAKNEKKHRDEYIKNKDKRSIFDNRARAPQEYTAPEQAFGGEEQLSQERNINLTEAPDLRAKYTHSAHMNWLKAWLGPSAGLVSHAERAKIIADSERAKKTVPEKEETPSETIKRTLKPGK